MAICSTKCSQCGSLINYVVNPDKESQSIKCERCGTTTDVTFANASQRAKDTIENLNKANAIDTPVTYFDQFRGRDTVEEALNSAKATFADAKDIFSSMSKAADIDTDITTIADQFTVSGSSLEDLKNAATGAKKVLDNEKSKQDNPEKELSDFLESLTRDELKEIQILLKETKNICDKQHLDPNKICSKPENLQKVAKKISAPKKTVDNITKLLKFVSFDTLSTTFEQCVK